jgi:glycerol-3-phosphate acyltransferase PlsY
MSAAAFLMVVLSYLLGSVPTGFLLGSLSGVDVRKAGSGNVGATNVARVVGRKQGLFTLLGDAAKGWIPTFLSIQFGFSEGVTSLVGLAAFLGHLYPVFLKFRGGKGVATALGILSALAPLAAALLVFVFTLVAGISRFVSLASIASGVAAPAVFWMLGYPAVEIWFGFALGLIVVIRHRGNIERLISGAEPKLNLW